MTLLVEQARLEQQRQEAERFDAERPRDCVQRGRQVARSAAEPGQLEPQLHALRAERRGLLEQLPRAGQVSPRRARIGFGFEPRRFR